MRHCIFCDLVNNADLHLDSNDSFVVVLDINPMREGHLLVISREHRMSFLDFHEIEKADLFLLLSDLIKKIESSKDMSATLIGNNGILMDENLHFHWHLVPRSPNDGFWDDVK